ncbi:hypothetical protein FOZG_18428, partial [Fusarium oxysporum Fo47]
MSSAQKAHHIEPVTRQQENEASLPNNSRSSSLIFRNAV